MMMMMMMMMMMKSLLAATMLAGSATASEADAYDCTRAKVFIHCDNDLKFRVLDSSADIGSNVVSENTFNNWREAFVTEIDVNENTVLEISCKDRGVIGGLIASMYYDGKVVPLTTEDSNAQGLYLTAMKELENVVPSSQDFLTSGWQSSQVDDGSRKPHPSWVKELKDSGSYLTDDSRWIWDENAGLFNELVFAFSFKQHVQMSTTCSDTNIGTFVDCDAQRLACSSVTQMSKCGRFRDEEGAKICNPAWTASGFKECVPKLGQCRITETCESYQGDLTLCARDFRAAKIGCGVINDSVCAPTSIIATQDCGSIYSKGTCSKREECKWARGPGDCEKKCHLLSEAQAWSCSSFTKKWPCNHAANYADLGLDCVWANAVCVPAAAAAELDCPAFSAKNNCEKFTSKPCVWAGYHIWLDEDQQDLEKSACMSQQDFDQLECKNFDSKGVCNHQEGCVWYNHASNEHACMATEILEEQIDNGILSGPGIKWSALGLCEPSKDYDYYGNDIMSFKTDHWLDCAKACRAHAICDHYTWVDYLNNSDWSKPKVYGRCWLKTSANPKETQWSDSKHPGHGATESEARSGFVFGPHCDKNGVILGAPGEA